MPQWAFNTPTDKTRVSRFYWRTGGRNKSSRDVIKALDLQSLDTGGTSGLHTRQGWAIALCASPISHIRRQALPEGFIYKRVERTVQRKARHQACPCLVSKNANTLQIRNSSWNTMEVWGDKRMKWERRMGVAKQKEMLNQSTNWFQRDSLALDLLPSSFQIAT